MMTYRSIVFMIMAASALAVLSMAGPAEAKKIGEWTCYDFLKASADQKKSIAYFFSGINLAEKKDTLDLAA